MKDTLQVDFLDAARKVLPFSLVCDEGTSMVGSAIDSLNEAIAQLFLSVADDPVVDDIARIGIIAFSDVAEVIQPLTRCSEVVEIPACVVKGSTSYHSAFVRLRNEIDNDVKTLKAAGSRVYRPVVFFISRGEPNDEDWRSAHTALIAESYAYRPHIFCFGVDGADIEIITSISTVRSAVAGQFAHVSEGDTNLDSTFRRWIAQFIFAQIGPSPQDLGHERDRHERRRYWFLRRRREQ